MDFKEMYLSVACKRERASQIIALFYRASDGAAKYFLFELGDVNTIKSLLGSNCDGKAINIELAQRNYWILLSKENKNMILFRRDKHDSRGYFDVAPDEIDLAAMDYIAGL